MHPRVLLRTSLLAALSGSACLLDPDIIGATITTTTTTTATITASDTGANDPTTGANDPTTGALDPTTGALDPTTADDGADTTSEPLPEGAYGAPCELAGMQFPFLDTEVTLQPACDDGICALVQDDLQVCQIDEHCQQNDPASACNAATFCELSPAFVAENSRCTRTCESVEDCPAMAGCETGVTCSVLTLAGDLCCQKMCACLDHLIPVLQAANQSTCDDDPGVCQ